MRTIEQWALRIADNDLTWIGLGWLRPKQHQRIGIAYVLFSSVLLGLPGVAAGACLIYVFSGRVAPQAWLALFALALVIELPLHALFACCWNRRADGLSRQLPAG